MMIFSLLLSLAVAQASAPPPAEAVPLTVMSFNIRYGTANDGDNHWLKRREQLFALLRERSAALLLERISARDPKTPAVVTGDFNAGESNPAAQAMLALFKDSFRVLHPDAREAGTFNGFKPGQTAGEKIDFVFVEPGTEVLDAAILRASRDGRYPSDHFPVSARVRLRGSRDPLLRGRRHNNWSNPS